MFHTNAIQKIKTHFMFNNFPSENRNVYDIMWQNIVDLGSAQLTIWRTHIARWIPKATNKHSEYVTLIAFPLQQLLYERASVLRHTYISCIVSC